MTLSNPTHEGSGDRRNVAPRTTKTTPTPAKIRLAYVRDAIRGSNKPCNDSFTRRGDSGPAGCLCLQESANHEHHEPTPSRGEAFLGERFSRRIFRVGESPGPNGDQLRGQTWPFSTVYIAVDAQMDAEAQHCQQSRLRRM